MNCPDSESLILAAPDRPVTGPQRDALTAHLASCAACRRFQLNQQTARAAYAAHLAAVPVPSAADAWRDVQARINQPATARRRSPLAPVIWFALPLAAAAAVALGLWLGRQGPATPPTAAPPTTVASAEFVEPGDTDASTMVYVDKESGWLVVWASSGDTSTPG